MRFKNVFWLPTESIQSKSSFAAGKKISKARNEVKTDRKFEFQLKLGLVWHHKF